MGHLTLITLILCVVLSTIGMYSLWWTTYQIWCLYLHLLQRYETWHKVEKTGWFVAVRNHSRSLEIASFNTAHMSSYYPSTVTSLSCTVSEIQRRYCRKIANF